MSNGPNPPAPASHHDRFLVRYAAWGMLKPRKGRKPHRRTRSGGSGGFFSQLSGHHRRSSSGATDMSVPISGSQGSPVHLPSQSSGSGHLPQDIPHQQRGAHQDVSQHYVPTHIAAAASEPPVIQGDNHTTAERRQSDSCSLKHGAHQVRGSWHTGPVGQGPTCQQSVKLGCSVLAAFLYVQLTSKRTAPCLNLLLLF